MFVRVFTMCRCMSTLCLQSDCPTRVGMVSTLATQALAGMAGSESVALTRVVQAFATALGAIAYRESEDSIRVKAIDVRAAFPCLQSILPIINVLLCSRHSCRCQ